MLAGLLLTLYQTSGYICQGFQRHALLHYVMDYSDSPLVQYLLTSDSFKLSPCTCAHASNPGTESLGVCGTDC